MNNQKRGKTFEQEWVEYLRSLGYWTHFMQPSPDGSQPFDVLAIYGNKVLAFDCKTLDGKRFPLSRIEDNQRLAFEALNNVGVTHTYFVVKIDDTAYIVPSQDAIAALDNGVRGIDVIGGLYASIHFKQDAD